MGIGAITIDAPGAVTAPTKFPLVLPSPETVKFTGHGPVSAIAYPGGRGFMCANGQDPVRHVTADGDTMVRTGLLAPYTAPTATPTGARASATMDLDATTTGTPYVLAAGDQFRLAGQHFSISANLGARPGTPKFGQPDMMGIKVGASLTDTFATIEKVFNGTGRLGVDYQTNSAGVDPSKLGVSVTAKDAAAGTIVWTADDYGTSGNGIIAQLADYSGGAGWPGAQTTFGSQGASVWPTGTAWTGYMAGGTDGSGTEPGAGTYTYAFGYKRQSDNARSGISQTVEADQGVPQNVDLAAMLDPSSNDDIDHKYWVRSQSGGRKLYLGADIVTADTTDVDDISNIALSKRTQYNAGYHRPYESGFINRVAHLAELDGMWFGAGVKRMATYNRGTYAVTAATDPKEVVITGGYPTKEMEHWTFRRVGADEDSSDEYIIVWVDEANQKVYLERDYEGSDASGDAYEIRDTRNPFTVYRCEPELPNQTGAAMFSNKITSPDARGVTGVVAAFGGLLWYTATGLWMMTGSPSRGFAFSHAYEGIGTVAGESIEVVDGIVYWLGTDQAIYAWSGSGEPFKASSPRVEGEDTPSGIARTCARINTTYMHNAFSHYDPVGRVLRWCVPLDSDWTNRYAIVLNFQTGAWSLDTVDDLTTIQTVTDPQGSLRTLAGDIHGNIWELDVTPVTGQGSTDGAYGFAPKFTVTSATVATVTDTATTFPTSGSGLAGVSFTLIDATGNRVRRVVASNTGTVLTPTRYFSAAPSAGTVGVCGWLELNIKSGRFTAGDPAVKKTFEALVATFAVDVDGQFFVAYAVNQGTPTVVDSGGYDLTATDGEEHCWTRDEGNRFQIELLCGEPGCDPAFDNLQLWFRLPEKVGA